MKSLNSLLKFLFYSIQTWFKIKTTYCLFECGLISRILYQLITHQFYVHSDELYNINKKREKCKIKNKLQDMKVTV